MLLVKYSEILLKGRMTRIILERMLERNVGSALSGCSFSLSRAGGVFVIESDNDEECAARLRKVFGVVYISVCDVVPARIDNIVEKCVEIGRKFKKGSSFAIRARRVGEHDFSSKEICVEAGSRVLQIKNKKLKVDLEEPDEEIFVDVRGKRAFISRKNIRTCDGMPLGSQGKVVAIVDDMDSYLAAWLMMRRGCELIAVCASQKGRRLAEKLEEWHIGRKMEVHDLSSRDSNMKREQLFKEAGRLVREKGALGVVSGESLCRGQKLAELAELDAAAGVPVYRPLILLRDAREMVVA